MSGWRRIGDVNGVPLGRRCAVSYVNYASVSVVKFIKNAEGSRIEFIGSGFFDKLLKKVADKYCFASSPQYIGYDAHGESRVVSVSIRESKDLKNVLNFMHDINQCQAQPCFTSDILEEIISLYKYDEKLCYYIRCKLLPDVFKGGIDSSWLTIEPFEHTIPIDDTNYYTVNDPWDLSVKISREPTSIEKILNELLGNDEMDFFGEAKKRVKLLLVRGAEVNAALKKAVHFYGMDLLKLLLHYGADPFAEVDESPCLYIYLKDCVEKDLGYFNATYATSHERDQKLQFIEAWLSRPRRQPAVKIEQVAVKRRDSQLLTEFALSNNQTLHAEFKSNAQMSVKEKYKVAKRIVKKFTRKDDKDGGKIATDAMDAINADGYVEIMRYNDVMVGFVFVQMRVMEAEKRCEIYCSLAQFDPIISGWGLGKLFVLRSAYCLQLMRPHYEFSGKAITVSIDGYRMFNGYLHSPMYQPHWLDDASIVNALTPFFPTGYSFSLVHDGMVCYLEDEMMVPSIPVDPEEHFNSEVLDCAGLENTDGRGAPIYFVTNPANFLALGKCFINLRLYSHYMRQFTQLLAHIMLNENINPDLSSLRDHTLSFWNGRSKKPVETSRALAKL